MTPSNWDKELSMLRENISKRLQAASVEIVKEETAKILGRVKIITHQDLGKMQYNWVIEVPEMPEKTKDGTR